MSKNKTQITRSTLTNVRVDFGVLHAVTSYVSSDIAKLITGAVSYLIEPRIDELPNTTSVKIMLNTLNYYNILVIDDEADEPKQDIEDLFDVDHQKIKQTLNTSKKKECDQSASIYDFTLDALDLVDEEDEDDILEIDDEIPF